MHARIAALRCAWAVALAAALSAFCCATAYADDGAPQEAPATAPAAIAASPGAASPSAGEVEGEAAVSTADPGDSAAGAVGALPDGSEDAVEDAVFEAADGSEGDADAASPDAPGAGEAAEGVPPGPPESGDAEAGDEEVSSDAGDPSDDAGAVSEGEASGGEDALPAEGSDPAAPEAPAVDDPFAGLDDGWNTVGGSEYYVVDGAAHAGWLVTDTRGDDGLQRYWFGSDGALAKDRLVSADEAGYWAYATAQGWVARGKVTGSDGRIYLADNDGRLEGPGWVVSTAYDPEIQRYWIDSETHAAATGFFEADGSWHHGDTNLGYVVRGKVPLGEKVLLADNEGRLEWTEGWLVTGDYDGGTLQRYRIDWSSDRSYMGARVGAFELGGNLYYGVLRQGYVARNCYLLINGVAYQADNDGLLFQTNFVNIINQIRGSGFQSANGVLLSDSYNRIMSAIQAFMSSGYNVGFMMVDLSSGATIGYNCDTVFYGASSIKAPYVVSFMRANGGAGSYSGTVHNCIVYSDNGAYATLRNVFGAGVFNSYLDDAGVWNFRSDGNYGWFTARDLAKMWYQNYLYLSSNQNGSSWLRGLLDQSINSGIGNALRGSYEVSSKPGWYPVSSYAATADGGIVWASSGSYILSIMSNAPQNIGLVSNLASAIDFAHTQMVS